MTTPNTQGASWEGRTQAFLEQFIATCKEKPCEGCLIDVQAVMNHIREVSSKERAEGERRGAERAVEYALSIMGQYDGYSMARSREEIRVWLEKERTLPADNTEGNLPT